MVHSLLAAALAECEARVEACRHEVQEPDTPAALDELADKRLALRKLLARPIQLIPETEGYRLRSATRIGALLEQDGPENRALLASRRRSAPFAASRRA